MFIFIMLAKLRFKFYLMPAKFIANYHSNSLTKFLIFIILKYHSNSLTKFLIFIILKYNNNTIKVNILKL